LGDFSLVDQSGAEEVKDASSFLRWSGWPKIAHITGAFLKGRAIIVLRFCFRRRVCVEAIEVSGHCLFLSPS